MTRVTDKTSGRGLFVFYSIYSMESSNKKRRRTNAEILADAVAAKNAPKKPRKRRTNAEIARDKERAARAEALKVVTYPVVYFYADVPALGKVWHSGESVEIKPGSYWASMAYDRNNCFIFNRSLEEQLKLWGRARYEVKEVPI